MHSIIRLIESLTTRTGFLISLTIIDILYDRLSLKSRALVNLAFYVALFLPFLVLLNDALWHYALAAFASGERSGNSAWNPPIWPFRVLLSCGFTLLALQVIAECLKSLLTLLNRPYSDVER